MNLIKLQIRTGSQKYPIYIGNNILNNFGSILKKNLINFNKCLLIVDKNVPKKLIDKVFNSLPKKSFIMYIINFFNHTIGSRYGSYFRLTFQVP